MVGPVVDEISKDYENVVKVVVIETFIYYIAETGLINSNLILYLTTI